MKSIMVTTSWDDGHVLDLKLAELLQKYSLSATFYISPRCREFSAGERLTNAQVRELAHTFEIGAHTMTHPRLPQVSPEVARQEIDASKRYLEEVIGVPVRSFCYPGGRYGLEHVEMVKRAGFTYARTVERFHTMPGSNPLTSPTTVHAYRHLSDALPIARVSVPHFVSNYGNWDALAIALFNQVFAKGGVYHLWGHGWEIEKNNDWERLERVFAHISKRPKVVYAPNKALV